MAAARLALMGRDPQEAWKTHSRSTATREAPDLDIDAGKNYFVTFVVKEREVEFAVPDESYVACSEDAGGLLVYKGEQFQHFIPRVR
jgi:hypothetical protein